MDRTREIVNALNPDNIKQILNTERIGKEVVVFKSTSSTNDIAWQYSSNRANDGVVIFAEMQSGGRGRRGNKWLAKSGQSLLFSVLLKNDRANQENFTLASAVAIAEVLGNVPLKHVKVKWPNDVLVDGKKIAGVLVESRGDDLVVGIGINCYQKIEDFDIEVQDIATSIDLESSRQCSRTKMAAQILDGLEKWFEIARKNSEEMVNKWLSLSSLIGTRVGIEFNNSQFFGNCIGIDPHKGLIMQIEGGGIRMFDAAHSSIVK